MRSLAPTMSLLLRCALPLLALFVAGCGTPSAPTPSRSVKVGPKPVSARPDPLRSWTDKTPAKLALVSFVDQSATRASAAYIPPAERVAAISEAAAAAIPAPVLRELVAYLHANAYRVFLVTDAAPAARASLGDGLGLAKEQIIGPYPQSTYKLIDGVPSVVPLADAVPAPKPVLVHQFAGRRPVLALGADASDTEMLEYAALRNPRPSLALVAPGPRSSALAAEAPARGWLLITAADWTK